MDIDAPSTDVMAKRVMNVTGCSDEPAVKSMAESIHEIAEKCRETMITDGSCGVRAVSYTHLDVYKRQVWYDLIGRNILETLVTDLNANGHTRLTIKENGDIVIIRNKKEDVQTHLENFPARNYWSELINIFKENELKAVARKDGLGISLSLIHIFPR